MSESRSIVLNVRLTPAIMALLEARATAERRPIRTMAALLLEDALTSAPAPDKEMKP